MRLNKRNNSFLLCVLLFVVTCSKAFIMSYAITKSLLKTRHFLFNLLWIPIIAYIFPYLVLHFSYFFI